jgi:hypothetical protein
MKGRNILEDLVADGKQLKCVCTGGNLRNGTVWPGVKTGSTDGSFLT